MPSAHATISSQPHLSPNWPLGARLPIRRRIVTGVAGIVLAFGVGGCSVSGTSVGTAGSYWLIKVNGGNGNIYGYPAGDKPGPGTSAQYLGPTAEDANRYAHQAAKSLGITHIDAGIY
jgi:hypothetical protein